MCHWHLRLLLFFVFVRGSTRVLIRDWFIDFIMCERRTNESNRINCDEQGTMYSTEVGCS